MTILEPLLAQPVHVGVRCPLCRKGPVSVVQRGIREDPTKPVYQCGLCLLQFITPDHADLPTYYAEEYRKTHTSAPGRGQETPEEHFNLLRPLMASRIHHFEQYIPKGATVLDVGCSSGYFMDALHRAGYAPYGCDYNPDDVAFVRDAGELPCEVGGVEEVFGDKTFTAVSACHVLEHVPDPWEFMKQVKKRIVGGGWIYLEVPNVDDALLSVYDVPGFRQWYYRDAHVTYWNMQNLASFLGALGFEAKVNLRQDYSLGNHFHWLMKGLPQDDAQVAQQPWVPVSTGHPASYVLNRMFAEFDRRYRGALDTLKACNLLVAVGRLREI